MKENFINKLLQKEAQRKENEMEYKIVSNKETNEVTAFVRKNSKFSWLIIYSGYSSEGRNLEEHWSRILEVKGFKKTNRK